MTRVVCAGIAVLDQVFLFDELPEGAGKHLARGLRVVGGGMAANGAAAVAALGGEGVLLSRVGTDPAGAAILAEFAACGVDTRGVERVPGLPSSLSTVAVDRRGERMLFNFTHPELLEEAPAPAEEAFGRFDALLADGRWPAAGAAGLALARRRGAPGVADLDHALAPTWRPAILEAASHLVFSRDGLRKITGEDGVEAGMAAVLAQGGGGEVAVTAGAEGVLWWDGERVRRIPAFRVAAVDTLGAGDVFHGAVALALGEGQPWPQALRFAAAAAALRCARPGGRGAFPGRAEVEQLMREQP